MDKSSFAEILIALFLLLGLVIPWLIWRRRQCNGGAALRNDRPLIYWLALPILIGLSSNLVIFLLGLFVISESFNPYDPLSLSFLSQSWEGVVLVALATFSGWVAIRSVFSSVKERRAEQERLNYSKAMLHRLPPLLFHAVILIFFIIGLFSTTIWISIERDRRNEVISLILNADGTRHAPWFNEQNFRTLRMGMTTRDIFFHLGLPLSATCYGVVPEKYISLVPTDLPFDKFACASSGRVSLVYADKGELQSNYRLRRITLEDGKLTEIFSEYALKK